MKDLTEKNRFVTSLMEIRYYDPCGQELEPDGSEVGWLKLMRHLNKTEPDMEPLTLHEIYKSNGLSDALWILRYKRNLFRDAAHYAIDIASNVPDIWTEAHPDDTCMSEAVQIVKYLVHNVGSIEPDRLEVAHQHFCSCALLAQQEGRNNPTSNVKDAGWVIVWMMSAVLRNMSEGLRNIVPAAQAARKKEIVFQNRRFLEMIGENVDKS